MLILKHSKNAPTCFDHYSDHLQGARRFLVKVTEFKSFILKFSDFNKEPTSSLKMIRIMIETCWSVF